MTKKTSIILALALALGSMTAYAQNSAQTSTKKEATEVRGAKCDKSNCERVRCDKSDKKSDKKSHKFDKQSKQDRRAGNKVANAMRSSLPDPYARMNITDAQRVKLDTLRSQYRKQQRERRAAFTCDTTVSRQQMRAQRDSIARADKLEYLTAVREIVGPDQYVIYLENIAINAPSGKGNMFQGNPGKRFHADKFDKKHGDRANKSDKDRKHKKFDRDNKNKDKSSPRQNKKRDGKKNDKIVNTSFSPTL